MTKPINISDGEWKLMQLLWESSPRTIAQLVTALREETGWTKATVFMMLTRLTEKGAVRFETGERAKLFYPILKKEEAVGKETMSFLSRVYGGSVGLMVASMAGQKKLSQAEIDELYAILQEARPEEQP